MNEIIKTKKKILDALQDLKEYEITWSEYVGYSKRVKARNKDEARDMFDNGEVEVTEKDIVDSEFLEDSLEIEEVE